MSECDLQNDHQYENRCQISITSCLWSPETDRVPACARNLRTSLYPRYSRLSVGYPGSLLELCLSGESLCMGFVKHM